MAVRKVRGVEGNAGREVVARVFVVPVRFQRFQR